LLHRPPLSNSFVKDFSLQLDSFLAICVHQQQDYHNMFLPAVDMSIYMYYAICPFHITCTWSLLVHHRILWRRWLQKAC